MSSKNYLITCLVAALATSAVILLVPGVAQTLETLLLGFLSTYASS